MDYDDFSDERLLQTPFGEEYFMVRTFLRQETENKRQTCNVSSSRTGLLHFFKYLFERGVRSRNNYLSVLDEFEECLEQLKEWSVENVDLRTFVSAYEGALLALAYYLMCSRNDYPAFWAWLQRNKDACGAENPFSDLIAMFERGRKSRKNTIFVSMQFGSCATEKNFKIIEQVRDELNEKFGFDPPLEVKRVDKIVTRETYEINEQVVNESVVLTFFLEF